MRPSKSDRGQVHRTSALDADVCALLVIQAELACLPAESDYRQRLCEQRDRVFGGLAERQLEQLRRVSAALGDLVAPEGRSQAA